MRLVAEPLPLKNSIVESIQLVYWRVTAADENIRRATTGEEFN
jgi:hypothetical protein